MDLAFVGSNIGDSRPEVLQSSASVQQVRLRVYSELTRARISLERTANLMARMRACCCRFLSLVSRCDARRAVGWGCSGSCQMLAPDGAGSMRLAEDGARRSLPQLATAASMQYPAAV